MTNNTASPISVIHKEVDTQQLHALLQTCDERSLVIWDIDGVILIGKDAIFHSDNIFSGLNQHYVDWIGKQYALTKEQLQGFLSRLLLLRPVQLVDQNLLSILDNLRSRHIKSIALTQFATGPLGEIDSVADWRIKELTALGVRFDYAFDDIIQIELNKLEKIEGFHPLYKQGILFCERHPKGDVLGAFFDLVPWQPNMVIFIDDKLEYLDSVKAQLALRNIPFYGLHYTQANKHPHTIDDQLVKMQFAHVMENNIWLSDEQARKTFKK